MYGLGTIINTGAIVAGGLAGILFGRFLKENVQDTLSKCCGVSTLMIGIAGALEKMLTVENGAISSGGSMLLVLCLTVGGVIGELLNLEGAFECFGRWLKEKTGNAKDKGFVPVDVIPGQIAMPVPAATPSVIDDARAALLSMGFSPQETDVALSGYDGQNMRVEDLLGAALKRLGMDA